VTDQTEHFVRFAARIMNHPVRCTVVPHEALELNGGRPAPAGALRSAQRRSRRTPR
jgi:hypothetical protein